MEYTAGQVIIDDTGLHIDLPRPVEMCNCEHVSHFDPRTDHQYLKVPAGKRRAMFVGAICDHCADTHMNEYLES